MVWGKKAPSPGPAPWYVPYNQIKPLRNAKGQPSVFIWQAFPWLKRFYTSYELSFDKVPPMQAWMQHHWWVLVTAAVGYLVMIVAGRRIMKNREPFDLKGPLAAWNLFLAVFSILGAIRTVPYLFYFMANISYRDINCLHPSFTHGEKDVGFWVMLFALSKLFELIDTLFIILRKKPLIFLHWYHHLTVLLFTTTSSALGHAGLFFVAMNYSVHSIMYLYFFLMAVKKVPKWFNPLWITAAQISQMFVGVFVSASAWYFKTKEGDACVGARWPLLWGSLAMYGSYLYLFLEFAVLRFIVAPRKRAAKLAQLKQAQAAASSKDEPPALPQQLSLARSVMSVINPPADDEGVPLLKPHLKVDHEASYSFHPEIGDYDDDNAAAAAKKKKTK